MRIVRMVEGAAVAEYSLDEASKVLTIEGVSIDLAGAEADCQTILNVTNDEGTAILGLGGKKGYIADVEIPPRRYENVEEEVDGKTVVKSAALPLDLNAVLLKLWPFPVESENQKEAE